MIRRCDLLPQYLKYKAEIDHAIYRVLSSGQYTLGDEVNSFEEEFAKYIGVNFGVSVANATDGLTLALRSIGVGPGDEVITTSFSAIPTLSAIIDSGATPVFVDINSQTLLMDLDAVVKRITPRTKAVLPVHIFGNVVDVNKLRQIIGPGIYIIEDASQAHGSSIGHQNAGSLGDISVFSFYPTKNLGAYGDGGIVMTNTPEIAKTLKSMRMYGMIDKDRIDRHGINSRLDEIQAAILRVKLKHLDEMNQLRQYLVSRYLEGLPRDIFTPQKIDIEVKSNYHIYSVLIKGDREKFIKYLDRRGIQTNIYYKLPLSRQIPMKIEGRGCVPLPNVEIVCERILALPLYPEFPINMQDDVIKVILEYENDY